MHQIRVSLRSQGTVATGKNPTVLSVLRPVLSLEHLPPHVKGNIGFAFTSGDLKDIMDLTTQKKVAISARAGVSAPRDVIVPARNTGMGPRKKGLPGFGYL